MNKQELIEELARHASCLEDFRGITGHCDGKYETYEIAIELAKQLDEPKKPVVPQFVADWFEDHKDDLEFPIWELCADSYNAEDEQGMLDWIQCSENKPIETLIRMKDGYEVEQEPLYMVPLLTDKEGNKKILVERRGQYDIIWDYENEGDWHELLTEEQIKSVNPDYWKLAVLYEPSEEVA